MGGWGLILALAEKTGFKYPQPLVNWTTAEDISNLLHLSGFEVLHRRGHILLPKHVPFLSTLAIRYLAHVPGSPLVVYHQLDSLLEHSKLSDSASRVSVICPCRNEAGNIKQLVQRLPLIISHTGLTHKEGYSQDDTLETAVA